MVSGPMAILFPEVLRQEFQSLAVRPLVGTVEEVRFDSLFYAQESIDAF